MFGIDAARHVALNELGGDRDVVHARGRVETVRAPERRKPVASVVVGRTDPRTLSILTVAGYADLGEDLGAARGVGGQGWARHRLARFGGRTANELQVRHEPV